MSSKQKKNGGFFNKIKSVFSPSSPKTLSRKTSNATSEMSGSASLGIAATRTRSRKSFMFGSREGHKEANAEAEALALEEKKAKCMAIKLAKRDPPAVQRLLVDCEFCNPPPEFGHPYSVPSPGYTSKDNDKQFKLLQQVPEPHNGDNEPEWNAGLHEWLEIRRKWLTPTSEQQPIHHLEPELTSDRYYTVYDKLIYQTRPFKHPLNLGDLVQILKAGWIGEGSWPEEGDVWSTDDEEEGLDNGEDVGSSTTNTVASNTASLSGGSVNLASPAPTTTATGDKPTGTTLKSNTSALNSATPVSGVAPPPAIHVQFSDKPHPREEKDKHGMAPLSRIQSSLGVPLRPVRSSQSSVVSITDSD